MRGDHARRACSLGSSPLNRCVISVLYMWPLTKVCPSSVLWWSFTNGAVKSLEDCCAPPGNKSSFVNDKDVFLKRESGLSLMSKIHFLFLIDFVYMYERECRVHVCVCLYICICLCVHVCVCSCSGAWGERPKVPLKLELHQHPQPLAVFLCPICLPSFYNCPSSEFLISALDHRFCWPYSVCQRGCN